MASAGTSALTGSALLLARIGESVQGINRSQDTLERLAIQRTLVKRVRGRLALNCSERRNDLQRLADDVRNIADDRLGPLWEEYEQLGRKVAAINEECLAFIEGILARDA